MKKVGVEEGLAKYGILPPLVRQINKILHEQGDEAADVFFESLSEQEKEQMLDEWVFVCKDRSFQLAGAILREVNEKFLELGFTEN